MRKGFIAALGVCFAAFIWLSIATHSPVSAQSATVTPVPTVAPTSTGLTCQNIVTRALTVLQSTCDTLGRNNACYGNDSIQVKLTSADFSFQHPGDKVPVKAIKTVTTSPLNQGTGTWGLSLFKLQANLPDTLPGQNVTFLVFGDTSIQNVSGDMRAFYFSTGLGAPSCDAVPNDSILVRSPEHEQVTFTANGVNITIASTVRLTAAPNQSMTVQLIEGHATVSTPKGSRVLQPSQSVWISMGGATGLQAQGIPSPATDASPDTTTLDMVSSLNTMTQSDPSIPIKGCVTAINSNGVTIGDVPVQMTADDLASRDLNLGDCLTVDADVQTDSSGNLVVVPTSETTGTTGTTADNTTDNTGNGGNGNSTSSGNCVTGKGAGPDGPGGKPPKDPPGPKGGPAGNPPAGPADAGCPKAKPAGNPGGPKPPKDPPGGKPPKDPPGGKPPKDPPGGKPPKDPPGGKPPKDHGH